jgi:hypothetical protein
MADVYAIFGTLLALGIVFPGMLTAWWLLFPGLVDKASQRVSATPWGSLGLGTLTVIVAAVPIGILLALPFGPAKFLGGVLLLGLLTFASIGAAGIASAMAHVLRSRMGDEGSPLGAFVRGALALELAAAFPFLGWFFFIPLTILASLGSATFALLGWGRARPGETTDQMEGTLLHEPQSA